MSQDPKIRHLLLDVLGTLVRDPYPRVAAEVIGVDEDELSARLSPHAWVEFERGTLGEEEYLATVDRACGPAQGARLRAAFFAAYEYLDGMQGLLEELGDRPVEVHLLSNYPPWFEAIDQRLGLTRHVSRVFVSARTGLRKPDPRTFAHALQEIGAPAAACLFVDDQSVHTRAAARLGLATHTFRGAHELRRALREHGLL